MDDYIEKLKASTYAELLHAMQSGVEFLEDKKDQTPKQLRVGVNSAMVNDSGLVDLLIEKGIITMDEYETAIKRAAVEEILRYRYLLAKQMNVTEDKIKLF